MAVTYGLFEALVVLAVVAAFLYAGARLFYSGAHELLPAYHIFRSDPIPIRNLHGRTGTVEIEGRAESVEEAGTVTAPITGVECLAYTYDVKLDEGTASKTIAEGSDGVDFVVSDDTGSVRVEPDGANLRLAMNTKQVSHGKELPEHFEAYVAATEDVEKPDWTVDLGVTELHLGNGDLFVERRLDVGESVHVYGQSRPSPATEWGSDLVDAVVADGRGAPVFVISDSKERWTAWRYVLPGLLGTVLGLYMVGFGIFLVLKVI